MNAALQLYSGSPESLPASDARQLCIVLGLTPEDARLWCGDIVDSLNVCRCGVVLVKPERVCRECR